MKNSGINSNREKQHIYYQNREGIHRMKKSVLHPPFSESQPEKAENRIFFIGSDEVFFDKNTDP